MPPTTPTRAPGEETVLVLALVGRVLVDPGNVDFRLLSPAWLGVAMFSLLPVLYGLLFMPFRAAVLRRLRPPTRRVRALVPYLVALAGRLALGAAAVFGGFRLLVGALEILV